MLMTLLICNASIKREVLTKNQNEHSCRIVSDGSIWRFSPRNHIFPSDDFSEFGLRVQRQSPNG
jgi:hypothetical protein